MLEPEILVGWVFKTKPFKQLHLKMVAGLSQTYTKILYENLKDYENIGSISKPLEQWNHILGFDNKSSKMVSTLKRDYLNKSIAEINEKTDLRIISISRKKKNGEVTMTVDFEKQSEEKLLELGLAENKIKAHKFYNKSKDKLDGMVRGGYSVVDEDMWIATDLKKNEKRYDSEERINKWLDSTDKKDQIELFEYLAGTIEGCDDPSVVIDDYKVIGLFSRDAFTRNPTETIEMMNGSITKMTE